MSEFLHMGGYAAYVWSSYAIAALVLVASAIWPYVQLRAIKRGIRVSHGRDSASIDASENKES